MTSDDDVRSAVAAYRGCDTNTADGADQAEWIATSFPEIITDLLDRVLPTLNLTPLPDELEGLSS